MKFIGIFLLVTFTVLGVCQGQPILCVSLEPDQPKCCDDIIKKIDDKFRSQGNLYKVVDYLPFNTLGGTTEGKRILIKGHVRSSGEGYHIWFEVKDLIKDKYLELKNSSKSIPTKSPSKWLDWVSSFQEDLLYYHKYGRTKIYVLVEPIVCLDDISPLDAHNLKRMFSSYTQLLNAHALFNKHFHFVERDATVASTLSPIATARLVNSPFVIMDPPVRFIASVAIEPSFANIEKLPTNLRDSLWIKYSRIQH